MASMCRIVYAIDGLKRLTVEPALTHDAVHIRAGSRKQASNCRSTVGSIKRILGLLIYSTLLHQPHEALATVERRECIHVIGAQLVDDNIHHQPGSLGSCLSFNVED